MSPCIASFNRQSMFIIVNLLWNVHLIIIQVYALTFGNSNSCWQPWKSCPYTRPSVRWCCETRILSMILGDKQKINLTRKMFWNKLSITEENLKNKEEKSLCLFLNIFCKPFHCWRSLLWPTTPIGRIWQQLGLELLSY